MPIRNPRWLPSQVIVLTQDHMGKYRNIFFSEAIALIEPKLCINHSIWSYAKTMSCSGSHLGILINIKSKKFAKDLPVIDAQFRFNQCNSFREENVSVFSHMVLC
jgi:hypothetical protein